jgi:hypothetical protein
MATPGDSSLPGRAMGKGQAPSPMPTQAHLSLRGWEARALWLIPLPGSRPDFAASEILFLGAISAC